MAEMVNPYANPYLPAFVSQRPRFNDPTRPPQPVTPMSMSYSQIHSVTGFDGARNYAVNNLANGASEIISDTDPNLARIYIVAKDSTGQTFMEAYKLIPETEPKPVTMDDLYAKMTEMSERINRLEEDKTDDVSKSGTEFTVEDAKQLDRTSGSTNNRYAQSNKESTNGNTRNASK